jgi:hypothetical protein
MDREDIIKMAKEVWFAGDVYIGPNHESLEQFAELVRNDYSSKHASLWLRRIDEAVKAEREACAKVCDSLRWEWAKLKVGATNGRYEMMEEAATVCEDAIRARGNT